MDNITTIRHPDYSACCGDWQKWRLTYEGGDCFIDTYLIKFSQLEGDTDFKNRKKITPCPAFAKAAVNEVKNSIFQRLADVARRGGSEKYQNAVQGKGLGVDLHGKSMDQFLGCEVIPELLVMKKVGIFVDMPPVTGPTLKDQMDLQPYLYVYAPEQICTWVRHRDRPDEFESLLLRDTVECCDDATGLPCGCWDRWRHVYLKDGVVHVQCYNCEGHKVGLDGKPGDEYIINLPYIPFVHGELSDSLLADAANHQIALLNMESSDINYALKGNIVFYVEARDHRQEAVFGRGPQVGGDGTSEEAATGQDKSIKVGPLQGRSYPMGGNAPQFINPSSEPLEVSMVKQQKLKDDIRTLVNLSLSNIKPKMASAESKAYDQQGLEAGLSYVGLVLAHIENRIARIWADYERSDKVAEVSYPKNYSLQTDEDRRKEVESLEELRDSIPSETFQRSVSIRMAHVLLSGKISTEELDAVIKEIKSAPTYTAKEEYIVARVVAGLLDKKLAAKILGMPEETVDKAAKEHVERLAAIAASQSAARGVPDAAVAPKDGAAAEKEESRETDTEESTEERVRGEGK